MLTQRLPASLSGLHSEMEQLFNGMLAPFAGWPHRTHESRPALPMNVWEDADSIRIEAEVPGVQMDDLEIYVNGNELTLRGRWQPAMEQVETWHRQERPSGEFSRIVGLSASVDAGKVEASLKDGVLSINLPKTPEYRPRKIEVKQIG